MKFALDRIFRRFITLGRLCVRWPDGTMSAYGRPETEAAPASGATPAGTPIPSATMRITDAATVRRLLFNPALAVGEAYMDGTLIAEGCSIYDLLDVLIVNLEANGPRHPLAHLMHLLSVLRRRLDQYNPAPRAQANVAHHYDLNGRLYSLFLDRDRQYSCAYFPRGTETLEEAQQAKKLHIAAKLKLDRPGLEVLDIGCGWGGMALTLARDFGARVTGITLSQEQLSEARARAAAEGLSDRVRFELMDYRALDHRFDRIVSVGMFEHVGVDHYATFFRTVARVLAPDGLGLLHAIGRSDPPGSTNPWITKYIFPGGYCPALSEVLAPIERSGLTTTDIEILRLHYAETLRHWRWRFAANRDAIATLYDERFCRMFEFYLCGSELAFRRQRQMVFQIQFGHAIDAAPLSRDYITDIERARARSLSEPVPGNPAPAEKAPHGAMSPESLGASRSAEK